MPTTTQKVRIPLHGSPISSAAKLFERTADRSQEPQERSQLLKAIHVALRGTEMDNASAVHSTVSATTQHYGEEELTWNTSTVVLSYGGVIYKKWSFEEEGQSVQWACCGWLELSNPPSSSICNDWNSSSDGSSSGLTQTPPTQFSQRPTFGAFSRARQNQYVTKEEYARYPAVYIFLRSIGRVFLKNGLDYTFSLPFIVRKAWPLFPHGVMIQRVLEPAEMEESEASGDAVLPTIFSVTNPFSEAAAVGLTAGIVGGFNGVVASLKDEEEISAKPLVSIPFTEHIVWISDRGNGTTHDIVVTVNAERSQLTVWRYTYVKPKDTPVPLGRMRTRSLARKRHSLSTVHASARRHSTIFPDSSGRLFTLSPHLKSREQSIPPGFPELPPLSSLPGMPPALSTTTTMSSLVAGQPAISDWPEPHKGRRSSLTRNDLSVTMDRMVLGGRLETDPSLAPIQHGRMRAAHWMEKLYAQEMPEAGFHTSAVISATLFDQRWDGNSERSFLAICFAATGSTVLFSLTQAEDGSLTVNRLPSISAISVTSIYATRPNVPDLLVVKPGGQLTLFTHGLREIPLELFSETGAEHMDVDADAHEKYDPAQQHGGVIAVHDNVGSSVTLRCRNGSTFRTHINLIAQDFLTSQALKVLSLTLPAEFNFALHHAFLILWSSKGLPACDIVQFDCFSRALSKIFDLQDITSQSSPTESHSWLMLSKSSSHRRLREDPVFKNLRCPPEVDTGSIPQRARPPHHLLAFVLQALHMLGEDFRFMTHRYDSVLRLAPVICRIALIIAPGWADYWKRLCPDAIPCWPSPGSTVIEHLDDRIPVWPPDLSALFYGNLSSPDSKNPQNESCHRTIPCDTIPSFAYGRLEPLKKLNHLTELYKRLSNESIPEAQKRAENAIQLIVHSPTEPDFVDRLPLGIAAPIREALRTCQLSPPSHWSLTGYRTIGRNDLAACVTDAPNILFNDGYRTVKDCINQIRSRPVIGELVNKAKAAGAGITNGISGVELELEEFTNIRFGQDRRLEEVSRMLCSSIIPSIRLMDRPELSEHDQAKEQQLQVLRIAERTLALPYGRAMFTFGAVPTVTRQAYVIPKLEYRVRMLPLNIVAAPEPGKISMDCYFWGEFHNGVAAALRLSPAAPAIDSSWITFNKPSELTPEHAGFLFGLGLTGHLKEMLTWHAFAYLTPKHDLTSIGVLLGLAAANLGNGDRHVTKLLAVHTPALLPTPMVDLNVSLMTQAAGLAGVGLLYMGTKNRRMAEVCLNQISRKDLVQPDLSNEHREAYTYSAALAFGMIMLGKGSSIPADLAILSRLNTLIHGDTNIFTERQTQRRFDINLTSPAATIALGLMYLRTERQDIADMLTIPDTVLALNRIQPSFLLLRTLARSLIMWDFISPTSQWLEMQVPKAIATAIELRFSGKPIDDALELAYYNIMAGCCFAIALKYAGTARQEAYLVIIGYFDLFSRLVYSNVPAFDHKIKRSAIREGLNLISISLSMVMAGTGEITCFRRLRFAYGMYHQAFRYGIHVATHMSLGLLFLGGGRYTLGTSDAAIACMVTAFFPRFHHIPSDNKSFLQALRHIWVLAVEPRCLIARDVDSKEVVYLPIKITMKDGNDVGITQLISPTLIPDLDRLLSIRVDTPRYWPFYLDTARVPSHRSALLRSQTLYVKRRSAFLSYTEDPRGSRSMFVRSVTSAGDAATLDYPQLTDAETHPAGDLSQFISSFSNDPLFLAFADHFARGDGETEAEQLFLSYCYATLLDSIMQDKPQTLQSHLTLYRYRIMSPRSRYFHLNLQDLRFAADFYSKVYDRRFSGRTENNARPPLIRETTVSGVLHSLDAQLDIVRSATELQAALGQYARGDEVQESSGSSSTSQLLAWYLLRNGVPTSALLSILRNLAREAYTQCIGRPSPQGTKNEEALAQGIKDVLHCTGTKMTTALGSGWSVRSLDEIMGVWEIQ